MFELFFYRIKDIFERSNKIENSSKIINYFFSKILEKICNFENILNENLFELFKFVESIEDNIEYVKYLSSKIILKLNVFNEEVFNFYMKNYEKIDNQVEFNVYLYKCIYENNKILFKKICSTYNYGYKIYIDYVHQIYKTNENMEDYLTEMKYCFNDTDNFKLIERKNKFSKIKKLHQPGCNCKICINGWQFIKITNHHSNCECQPCRSLKSRTNDYLKKDNKDRSHPSCKICLKTCNWKHKTVNGRTSDKWLGCDCPARIMNNYPARIMNQPTNGFHINNCDCYKCSNKKAYLNNNNLIYLRNKLDKLDYEIKECEINIQELTKLSYDNFKNNFFCEDCEGIRYENNFGRYF